MVWLYGRGCPSRGKSGQGGLLGNAWDEFKDFNFEPVSFYHELLVKLDFPFQSTTKKKELYVRDNVPPVLSNITCF